MREGALRRGDIVEVRRAGEILATLDEQGTIGAMSFMPEMIPYLGRRFMVQARADKICDTIGSTLRSRRMTDTVLLDDLRCDGRAHGGCQADCRIYWNEAWLKKVNSLTAPAVAQDETDVAALRARIEPNVRASGDGEGDDVRWKCQVTEANRASEPLSNTDPRPYFNELLSGNVGPLTFVEVMFRAAYMQPMHRFKVLRRPKGPNVKSPRRPEPLNLQPGEWVRVKSLEAIEETLTTTGSNRGLHFDIEMVPFCNQVMQVRGAVTQIIEEHTGRMLRFHNECIKLEGAVCSAKLSTGRFFCPRKIYPYWREAWLERADGPPGTPNAKPGRTAPATCLGGVAAATQGEASGSDERI
ncbi:hypothetical protein [Hyphomicrobium sp. 2TAF46]|uniref:hypothetical protein n=1 Tax=Hyphomicrobium sp. 2TAF46 TaxID=3233019 RepID=UPI003F91997F